MIFIAVGTQKFPLNRLFEDVDSMMEQNLINEPVFAQIGTSSYCPKHFEYTDYMNPQEFEKKIDESDLIITHSGVGTIIDAIKKGKHVVVYPRLSKYGEHVDDHQLEIAESFENMELVVCCRENDSLAEKIELARKGKRKAFVSCKQNHIRTIRNFIENEVKPK